MKLAVIVLSFFHLSCSQMNASYKSRPINEYYTTSGIVRYFLADIPDWINFSSTSACKRTTGARYFHLKNLRESFNYSYKQAVSFQVHYNQLYQQTLKNSDRSFLSGEEEERLFYETSEKVEAKISSLELPTFPRVHVVWIDPFLNGNTSELKSVLLQDEFLKGQPVLLSFCLDATEMTQFVTKNLSENIGRVSLLPFTSLSIFGKTNEMENFFVLYLDQLFEPTQKIHFYYPKNAIFPSEVKGDFTKKKF